VTVTAAAVTLFVDGRDSILSLWQLERKHDLFPD